MLNTSKTPKSLPEFLRKALFLATIVTGALTLSGCQSIAASQQASEVRIINASPDAPGMDIYINSVAVASNLGFGTITSYIPVDQGTYTTSANAAGTKQTLVLSKSTFATGAQYTVLIGNVSASLAETVLTDQSAAAPVGQVALRFIDQATHIGAQDIYLVPAGQKLSSVSPTYSNISFNINTGYLNVPVGAYTLYMVPAGHIAAPESATYTGNQVTYTSGSASTVVLIDQQLATAPGLQVLIAPDFISPTATM